MGEGARRAGEGKKFADQTDKNLFTSKKAAFTLAEVLITLGIIGVVAALTIPVLMAEHRKTVIETRLKKFYSTINQAITMAEVDYGDKKGWTAPDTETFWETYLKPYLQYMKEEDLTFDGYKRKVVYLPDGSVFLFDLWVSKNADGTIALVTNGGHFDFFPEAKNYKKELIKESELMQYGTKYFRFGFWPNENHLAFIRHKNKGVEPYMANWTTQSPDFLKTNTVLGCNPEANGSYCTVVIARNGWKIPKDYPKKL